jgi:hypothetical protein
VENFLDYAYQRVNDSIDEKIYCPCISCVYIDRQARIVVQTHLLYKGIKQDYTTRDKYGENKDSDSGDSDIDIDSDRGGNEATSCK